MRKCISEAKTSTKLENWMLQQPVQQHRKAYLGLEAYRKMEILAEMVPTFASQPTVQPNTCENSSTAFKMASTEQCKKNIRPLSTL